MIQGNQETLKTVSIELTLDELNIVLDHLAQGRFAVVNQLVANIQTTALAQLNQVPAETATEATEVDNA